MAHLASGNIQHIQAARYSVTVIIFSLMEAAGAVAAAAQFGEYAVCIHGVKHLQAVFRHGDDDISIQFAKAIQ